MYCNNCGKKGHVYKECKLPVTSCGNIIFRLDKDEPKVLMIQRKDSLCYIDFIRGKYDRNINYIQILIDKCSISEKERLKTLEFKELWKDLWLLDEDFKQNDDYLKSYTKFQSLKEGMLIKDTTYTIETFINASQTNYRESEWEFPKGRRNMNENDFECANREFCEESGYCIYDYDIINNICPFIEEFIGENRVRYKYIYYIGKLKNLERKPIIDKNNFEQVTEIRDIKWVTKKESLYIIRNYHHSRRKIINKIFDLINLVKSDAYSLIE